MDAAALQERERRWRKEEEEAQQEVDDEEVPNYYVPMSVFTASDETFGSHGALYTTAWDSRRKKWVLRDSRPPPQVLCQVQEEPINGEEFAGQPG